MMSLSSSPALSTRLSSTSWCVRVRLFPKTELTERLYDQDFERDSNVIEVFVGRLRKKLDPENSIKPIETLRGRGYRFGLEREQSV